MEATHGRTPWRLWFTIYAVGVAGIGLALVHPLLGALLFVSAVAQYLARAAIRARFPALSPQWLLFVPGAIGSLVGLWLFQYGTLRGTPTAAAICAAGTQLLLFTLSLRRTGVSRNPWRNIVVVLGHAVGLLGIYAVLVDPGTVGRVAGAAFCGSLLILTLDAYWAHRNVQAPGDKTLRSWEAPFLILVGVGSLLLLVSPLRFGPTPLLATVLWLKLALLSALGLLAGPPHLPPRLRAREGGRLEFFTQAIGLGILLNLFVVMLVLRWSFLALPLFILLTAWLMLAVVGEYAVLVYGASQPWRKAPPRAEARIQPYTVVIAAMNEAATIRRTVHAALVLPLVRRVVVVVGQRSSDDTYKLVDELRSHAGPRLVLLRGEGHSKADDLNQCWASVETPFAMILDADETVDVRTLATAFDHFRDPTVGIVQGRKTARDPTRTAVDRFVTLERRFSTLFDQVLQSRHFDAAHFAGSGALLRREVPMSVNGWSPRTLTEDIEFTMRLYLGTPWRIAYEPTFLIYEESPRRFDAFLRQRGRWARGWSQVAALHLAAVWRHPTMPRRRRLGLAWQLVTAISAPWSIFLPAAIGLSIWGAALALPAGLAIVLGAAILPSRIFTYGYPYFHDPAKPYTATPMRVLRAVLGSYAWILIGWLLQLQALYLELSAAPRVWHATRDVGVAKAQAGPTTEQGAA